MTADLHIAPRSEPLWWTLYPSLADAVSALGRQVAHLADGEPVSIGHPTDTTEPARHVFVRYQDPDGATYGVATLPQPDRMVCTPGDTEGVAIGVATIIGHAGHAPGCFSPEDTTPAPHGPLRIDGTAYPSFVCGAAPGVYAWAALLPDGSAVALWGPPSALGREITLARS